MSITDPLTALKIELTQTIVPQVVEQLATALQKGLPVHTVERGLWDLLLGVGHRALGAFFDSHGTGDQGEHLALPDGQDVRRLESLHPRRYVSIFGEFRLMRTVYGTREGQALAFVPLDNRLQLPAGVFSYVLQDWDQALAMEQAFGQVNQTIARMLHVQQSVDSLEAMNHQMATDVDLLDLQPAPPAAQEGEVLVVTADGKGIVIRGQGTPTVCGGERPEGARANQKRMATVGAVYTVAPHVRTAAEVVAALFRDPGYEHRARPKPCHKHVWASLPTLDPKPQSSIDMVFSWLDEEQWQRHPPGLTRPMVYLCDGQKALWQACEKYLPTENAVQILDLLHVTPRLWQAGKLLYGERSAEVVPLVRYELTQILEGKVDSVIRRLRRHAVNRNLTRVKKKSIERICGYLRTNRNRMRYHEYLQEGYPIASGMIEGACRHLIKDRMERAGMHWTLEGAQAMLDLRSVYISDRWEEYQKVRIAYETNRSYPHRKLVAGEAFFALAV